MACPTGPKSAAVRNYWFKNYNTVKMLNPRLPFLIRDFPDEDKSPYIIVKYDFNETKLVEVEGKSEEELDALLESLVDAGDALPRSKESDPYVLPPIVE